MSWTKQSLGQVASVIPGYAFKSAELGDEGMPVLKIGNILEDSTVDVVNTQKLPESLVSDRLGKFWVEDGDILLAMTGATAGKMGRVRADGARFLLNQRVAKIVPKTVDHDFLWLQLNTKQNRELIFGLAAGAAQPNISGSQLEAIQLAVPDTETQSKIATVLIRFDYQIANNRRRIKLLEEAARLIFREWFVQLRFPGYEHTAIENGVPAGWQKVTLGEIADVVMGQSPDSKFYNEAGVGLPFHQGVKDFGLRYPTTRMFCSGPGRIAEEGDILVSVRAPVGRLNYSNCKLVIGRGLAAVRSKSGNQGLLFQLLKGFFFKEDIIGSGAIYAAVTRSEFLGIELLSPPSNVADEFSAIVDPIEKQIKNLGESNERLQRARDLLMPRLMSGELEV